MTLKLKNGKKIIKSLEKGIGFGLGLVLVSGILFSVYAFVEPTLNPSNNYVIDNNSTLLKGTLDCNNCNIKTGTNLGAALTCNSGFAMVSSSTFGVFSDGSLYRQYILDYTGPNSVMLNYYDFSSGPRSYIKCCKIR